MFGTETKIVLCNYNSEVPVHLVSDSLWNEELYVDTFIKNNNFFFNYIHTYIHATHVLSPRG
jgi:hypothetical protein